jgi:inactivated superfamily I helicase
MNTDNFFKFVEVLEASSAKELASKIREINIPFHLNQIWSDGSKHYALINAKKRLPARVREELGIKN